ncbi:hypothetical protein BDD12DRAFT_808917 [Trichophaea hybrida]|nr:hypothetical protein BDD12DRAFT_808917 [Trichophaea hybrida]
MGNIEHRVDTRSTGSSSCRATRFSGPRFALEVPQNKHAAAKQSKISLHTVPTPLAAALREQSRIDSNPENMVSMRRGCVVGGVQRVPVCQSEEQTARAAGRRAWGERTAVERKTGEEERRKRARRAGEENVLRLSLDRKRHNPRQSRPQHRNPANHQPHNITIQPTQPAANSVPSTYPISTDPDSFLKSKSSAPTQKRKLPLQLAGQPAHQRATSEPAREVALRHFAGRASTWVSGKQGVLCGWG